MVWQQWRAIQVEAAERARTQSAWILSGALDWARLILREDAKTPSRRHVDHLGEPWAVPLAEARLSTFLAADKDNTDDAPDAFLSGAITDAQARYNLTNLLEATGDGIDARELASAAAAVRDRRRVDRRRDAHRRRAARCGTAAAPPTRRERAPRRCRHRRPRRSAAHAAVGRASSPGSASMPESLRALEPYVVLFPTRSGSDTAWVNVNTAPREVLVAAVDKLDLATAERIVQSRQRAPLKGDRRPARRSRRALPADNLEPARRSARTTSRCAGGCDSATSSSSSARWCSARGLDGRRPAARARLRARADRARKPRQSENQYGDFAAGSPSKSLIAKGSLSPRP